MPTTRPAAALLLLVLAVVPALGACDIVSQVTGPRAWSLGGTTAAGVSTTVTLTDASGLVKAVEFDPADADVFSVNVPPAHPDAVDVPWIAGACDKATTLAVAAAGAGLEMTVDITTEGACDAFGTPRAVRLTLARPLPPGSISVVQVMP